MSQRHTSFDGGLVGGTPVVLGIDQSYTGFAATFMASSGEPAFASHLLRTTGQGVSRTRGIMDWLEGAIAAEAERGNALTDAAMEAPVRISPSSLISGELSLAVRLVLDGLPRPSGRPLQVPPMTLKKYATGRGNAKKNEVLLAVYKHFGVEFSDDNMADSYVLARIVSGRADLAHQRDIVAKMRDPKHRDA